MDNAGKTGFFKEGLGLGLGKNNAGVGCAVGRVLLVSAGMTILPFGNFERGAIVLLCGSCTAGYVPCEHRHSFPSKSHGATS